MGNEEIRVLSDRKRVHTYNGPQTLESIKEKAAVETSKIQRWMTELERFNFTVKYQKGEQMHQSDILSRIAEDTHDNANLIMKIHENLSHRKNIMKNLEDKGIKISERKLKKLLENCEKCRIVDKTYEKSNKYVVTSFPGEIISMDLMDIDKRFKVIVSIDYFSRKIWAQVIENKESRKVRQFVEKVYESMKFKTLLTDNGREFNNIEILKICKDRDINRKLSGADKKTKKNEFETVNFN